jgi:hypothetical protein
MTFLIFIGVWWLFIGFISLFVAGLILKDEKTITINEVGAYITAAVFGPISTIVILSLCLYTWVEKNSEKVIFRWGKKQ